MDGGLTQPSNRDFPDGDPPKRSGEGVPTQKISTCRQRVNRGGQVCTQADRPCFPGIRRGSRRTYPRTTEFRVAARAWGRSIGRLKNDPLTVAAGRGGTDAMTDVLRIWTERCAPDARGHLDADVALRWDNSLDIDAAIDAFATFLCRHRDAGESQEAI